MTALGGTGTVVLHFVARRLGLDTLAGLAGSPYAPYLAAYVALTFTLGAALTHVYDTPGGERRERATDVIQALLRAVGLLALTLGARVRATRDALPAPGAARGAHPARR
jgi:hypothetical protein